MTLIFSLVWRYSVAEMYILGISSETLLPSNLTETIKDGVVSSKEFAQSFTGMECVCTNTSYEESSIFVALRTMVPNRKINKKLLWEFQVMKMTLFLEIRTKLRIKEVTVKNKTWDSSQHYDMDAGELHRALQGQMGALFTESSVFVSSGTAKLHMTTSSKVTTDVDPTSSDWQKQLWHLVTSFLVGQAKAVLKLYPRPELIFSCSHLLSFFVSTYTDPRGCPHRYSAQ